MEEQRTRVFKTVRDEHGTWRKAWGIGVDVLGEFHRTGSLECDAFIRLDDAAQELAVIRRDRKMDLVLRIWTAFLTTYGRGPTLIDAGSRPLREKLALAAAELLCGSDDLGGARPAYRHLLFEQLQWLKADRNPEATPLDALEPRFRGWMAALRGTRRVRNHPPSPAETPASPVPAAEYVPSAWNRTSPEYRASDFRLRQLMAEWEAFRAGDSYGAPPDSPALAAVKQRQAAAAEREIEWIRRHNAGYMCQYRQAYQREPQYLGNVASDHWTNPRSHH